MESADMDRSDTAERPARGVLPGAIVAGVILLALGIAMLADRTGLVDVRVNRLVAPLVLIAMGTAIVLDRDRTAERRRRDGRIARRRRGGIGGIWLVGVGSWMLISQSHLFGLTFHTSWPIIVIMAGVIIVIRGVR